MGYMFERLLPSLGPLKDRFKHVPVSGRVHLAQKPTVDPQNHGDRLYWVIDNLQDCINSANPVGAFKWFNMLEHEMLRNTTAQIVDKRFYDQLSDLATVDDMRVLWFWSQMHITMVPDDEMKAYWAKR